MNVNYEDRSFKMFDIYRRINTGRKENKYCDLPYLLRIWEEAKSEYLYKLLGNELILTKTIRFEADSSEVCENLNKIVAKFRHGFIEKFISTINTTYNIDIGNFWYSSEYRQNTDQETLKLYYILSAICEDIRSSEIIYQNTFHMPRLAPLQGITHYDWTINGKRIQIADGMKLFKLIGKIASVFDLDQEFEEYRIACSQVTNARKITGKLSLSIHPLDYATASDNDNGWNSCMSWADEGCYRMGTVEMMNSSKVICAYVSSDHNKYMIQNEEWNSKKWRAWVIVTPEVIMVNRNYPYHNDGICDIVVDWVRQLAHDNLGWEYQKNISHNLTEYISDKVLSKSLPHLIKFTTDFMYNDVGDDDVGCLGSYLTANSSYPSVINFSGSAECMTCGCPINTDNGVAESLICNDCDNMFICPSCGERCSIDDGVYTLPNGEQVCEACYNEQVTHCPVCDTDVWNDDTWEINFPLNSDIVKQYLPKPIPGGFRSRVQNGCICQNCLAKHKFKIINVPRHKFVEDSWGWRYSFSMIDPRTFKLEDIDTYNAIFDLYDSNPHMWAAQLAYQTEVINSNPDECTIVYE